MQTPSRPHLLCRAPDSQRCAPTSVAPGHWPSPCRCRCSQHAGLERWEYPSLVPGSNTLALMSDSQPQTFQDVNRDVIEQFRGNNGVITSGMFKGARLLLLTSLGARSGKARVNPLAFTRDGERYVVIASKGGAPTHPDWYHNVVAHPEVSVEVATDSGIERFQARARVAEGDERRRLYDAQAALMPGFAEYQQKTSREIPVVVLEKV
jgi:deazaflavin-dependent oxidoreductase (nitroreductase family)